MHENGSHSQRVVLSGIGLARALCYESCMSRFFNRNLEFRGRLVRGVLGGISLIAGIIVADFNLGVCLGLVAFGLFAIFEAARGWCLMRACGIRTKM